MKHQQSLKFRRESPTTRAHKVTYNALRRFKLKEFGEWTITQNDISEEEQNRIINTLQECLTQFKLSIKKSGEQEEESELLSSVDNFRHELDLMLPYLQTFEDFVMATSQMAAFWNLYLKLVQLLLDYMSTGRNSNIPLHLETSAEMLLFDFIICNHQNDARWGV